MKGHGQPNANAIGVGAMLQDIELMPQSQDFGFQPPPRFEAVAQGADERAGNCNHTTIML
jgi:hypothetical protein